MNKNGLIALVALALPLILTPLLAGAPTGWLEDWTGETELKQQVIALTSTLSQRAVSTQDLLPLRYNGLNPYGVNTFFEQEVEEAKVRQSMEMIQSIGARWIRQHVPWADIETPVKGQYVNRYGESTWQKYDRIVNLAAQYGLNIVARLDDPPDWSRQDNSVHNRPPDDLQDFGDFVYTFVQRYKGRIKYFQIWNEPNIYPEWGNRPVDARGYVELLKVAYNWAREADPQAVILSAPLAPTLGTPDGMNESDPVFLQKMYESGIKDYFDILMVNIYGLWTGPGDRRIEDKRTNFSRVQLIREIMVRNGDAQKSMWAAELGWNALPRDFPGEATHGRVTEEQQARYTVAAYRRAQEEWPWMGVIFYWHFRMVSDEDRSQVVYYFRMADPDFTPHSVYYAFRDMALSPPLVYYGYHQETHWALSFQGYWRTVADSRAVLGDYAVSQTAGDTLTFTFKGMDLDILTRFGPRGGKIYVSIDNDDSRANQLPLDRQGRAYLDTGAGGESWQVRIPVARGLRYEPHRMEIRVADAGGPVVIDGIIVNKGNDYLVRLMAGIGVLVGVALALILTRGRFS